MGTTTTTTITETLTLTKAQREKLETLFSTSAGQMLKRVKALMPYHQWTVDQVIAAMHTSADAEGVPLDMSRERATMARSMAVVKAWVTAKAHDVIDDGHPSQDYALTNLAQIANVTPGALSRYEIPKDERGEDGARWGIVIVEPTTKETYFEPFEVEIPWGSGEKAMPEIVNAYLTERLMGEDEGDEWLATYRRAVVYANNEKRRLGQAHDTNAADARVGQDSKQTGARNPGGKQEPEAPKAPAPNVVDNRTPGQKTLVEASTGELIRALSMRIADYTTALTVADAQAWSGMTDAYEVRFEKLPIGATLAPAVKATAKATEKAQDEDAQSAQDKVNKAPAPLGTADQLRRAIRMELEAQGMGKKQIKRALKAIA